MLRAPVSASAYRPLSITHTFLCILLLSDTLSQRRDARQRHSEAGTRHPVLTQGNYQVRFFDTTPMGRVLNRFASDQVSFPSYLLACYAMPGTGICPVMA